MRYGVKPVIVTQESPDDLKALTGRNAAYREWQRRLGRRDALPRGRYFRGKRAGRTLIFMDEVHQITAD